MKLSTTIKIIKFIKKIFDTIVPYPIQDLIQRKFFGGTYLSQVEFHIVDHCNLNCAYCDHFTPLAKENILNIEDIIKDFKLLKKVFDKVGTIYILGGEPLLHPSLSDIFLPLRTIYPDSEIVIITNGILLSEQTDEFWSKLKQYNIALSMTKYPLNVDYSYFEEKCKNLGIKIYFFAFNRDKMQKMDLNPNGNSNKKQAFLKCSRKHCHFLREGKLYVCTPVPNVKFLNNFFNLDFKVTSKDYVDLNKVKSASKINSLFSKPIEFCKYCSDCDLVFDKYKVSKKEKSEWVRES